MRVCVNLTIGIEAILTGITPVATFGCLQFLECQIKAGYHIDFGITYHSIQCQFATNTGA